MGAEDWMYFVPFQDDVAAALKALRLAVFEDLVAPDQHWPDDWPRPTTIEELQTLLAQEQSYHDGILDLDERLIGPGGSDEFRAIRRLSQSEIRDFFGTDRPTRADFERAYALARTTTHPITGPYGSPGPCPPGCIHLIDPPRDCGRCVVLYDQSGQPTEIVFWGHTGD
jgi:hypothetical protein